ncbi:glycosyltransferase family 2 protein [Butyrivibrio sp. MC2021]|uniref:glycosyltransferase family 2 protein n=1 Tax=Butyrivibrio sp. MC2021 TaxID=1408306 RepID=UPI0006891ADB|nr:glycosyltransferase family 2 protein [Butyrivibrio sp. MC2021]
MVSVIVPVYGVEEYLDRCVQSICNQTYSDLEIILVDDGSKDSCPEMCDEWSRKDKRIKVIHQENGGLSNARNTGLYASNGEFILYVDSDDYIREDMVEALLDAINSYSADVAVSTYYSLNDDYSLKRLSGETVVGTPEEILPIVYNNSIFHAWGKLIKREYALKCPFVDKLIYEDYENTPRLFTKVNKIVILMDGRYQYTIRSNSIMQSSINVTKVDLARIIDSTLELYENQNFTVYSKAELYALLIKLLVHHYHITIRSISNDNDAFLLESRSVLKKHKNKWISSDLISKGRKIAYFSLCFFPPIYRKLYLLSHKEKQE